MSYDPAEEAFDAAKKSFHDELKDQKLYDDILANAATVDDVYQMAAKLQEEAASQSSMRNLRRLQPFLDILSGYGQVIEVFVQVKPEILALIWGPIRLILKWSSELTKALDAMADAMVKIAQTLPQFSELVNVFPDSVRINAALALFYGDILQFYRIILKVFRNSRWKTFWDTLWSRGKENIDTIIKQIAGHVLLMRNEVSVAEIIAADKARVRSLIHFEETQQFQELQKFQGLRTRLDPPQYGERLDWLRNRVHQNSSKWLLQDMLFQEWLDISTRETTWLWIQGIPGSGKTYIAAAAVDEAARKHRALFVFISHNNFNSTTALSITQSLVFQAAADDHTLQTMVVDFSEREFTSDGGKALELLKALLTALDETFIIIDGLDEMEESERYIFLRRLDTLAAASTKLKILICSRPEDDIVKALSKKSKSLRVDQRNMASIQGFVDDRAQEWMAQQDFSQHSVSEISYLLSPLAARANGMFLYARIVLDNLVELSSIEEIRQALKALPTDLNDAYQRVFNRINNSHRHIKEKARRILGWIGCAPAPMTTLEMEQALLLERSVEGIPSIIGTTNFLKLCGPIIEIVNEKPQFVHFTVREYIFSLQIDNYIHVNFACNTLAVANLAYLCSGLFDLDSADSVPHIRAHILAGNYRLLGYVSWYWAGLTLTAIRIQTEHSDTDENIKRLKTLIPRAITEAWNDGFNPDEESFRPKIEEFNFDCGHEGRDMLRSACRFRRDERQPDWTITNADTWVDLDPLVTSKIAVRVKEHFESLLCGNDTHDGTRAPPCNAECPWATLQRHYGPGFYRCSYFSCPYSRNGFVSRNARNDHEKAHGRPWKCPITSCQFSVIGFLSQEKKNTHVKRFHDDESEPMTTLDADNLANSDFDNLDENEVQPLLFILARTGNVKAVKRLLASPSGSKIRPNVLSAARASSARQGSMAMTQLLTPEHETHLPSSVVVHAVESEDAEFVEWALQRVNGEDIEKGTFNKVMLSTPSDEIYSLWEACLLKFPFKSKSLFKDAVFNAVKDSPFREERLAHTWGLLFPAYSNDWYKMVGRSLVSLARTSMSVRLGRALLQLVVDIQGERSTVQMRDKRALLYAARKTTKEAAEFMEMLIENGNSVHYVSHYMTQYIGDEVGARNIQQWLGYTFEELVERNREKLERRRLFPNY